MKRSKRINIILHDGGPYGLRTVEMSNWNGKIIICPRSALSQLKEQVYSNVPALYVLLSDDNSQIYIGETDSLSQRLAHHATNKDFWTYLVAFTSPEFSKTEVRYLEHVLLNRIEKEKRFELHNSKNQQKLTIRPDVSDAMDEYLDLSADALLAVGIDLLAANKNVETELNGVSVFCSGPDAEASGLWTQNGLLVYAGSKIRKQATTTTPTQITAQVHAYINSGLLVDSDTNSYALTEDHLFTSASRAAGFILGRSANGLTEWKTKDGIPIKELEAQSL